MQPACVAVGCFHKRNHPADGFLTENRKKEEDCAIVTEDTGELCYDTNRKKIDNPLKT